ncbi:MAG: protein-export chaperone SecB [Prevotellaceae bacterium]|jgi:preprotein translocase subunit SecB|nr:protein-export chaperone SecB [Prevotellaceae bacterium]
MEVSHQTKLTFHGVDILDVDFHAITTPEDKMDIKIDSTPRVFYPKDNKYLFKVVTEIELKDERYFTLRLRAIGHFELNDELSDELKKKFVNANAPAIMFPYIRSFITTLTANAGIIGTLIIPAQFFKGTLEELEEISA